MAKEEKRYQEAEVEIKKAEQQIQDLRADPTKPINLDRFNRSIDTAQTAYIEAKPKDLGKINERIVDSTKGVVNDRQAAEQAQERAAAERAGREELGNMMQKAQEDAKAKQPAPQGPSQEFQDARAAFTQAGRDRVTQARQAMLEKIQRETARVQAAKEATRQADRKAKEVQRDSAKPEDLEKFTQRLGEVKDSISKLKEDIKAAEGTRAKFESDSKEAGQNPTKLLEKLDQALQEPKERLAKSERELQEIEKKYAALQEKGNVGRKDLGQVRRSLDECDVKLFM